MNLEISTDSHKDYPADSPIDSPVATIKVYSKRMNINRTDDFHILESGDYKKINVIEDNKTDYWKIWLGTILIMGIFAATMLLFNYLYSLI